MNFSPYDYVSGPPRYSHWTPLVTQQLRFRHLFQVMVYNLEEELTDGFYYTLHATALSAPLYTSRIVHSKNPKWNEMEREFMNNATTAFVIRIWQGSKLILTWGVNLSGLVYLGIKLTEIQPESFRKNTVIFHLHGGFFTCLNHVRTDLKEYLPFIDYLNVVSTEEETKIFRLAVSKCHKYQVKDSYGVEKLRRLHLLQRQIKNHTAVVENLKESIKIKLGNDEDQDDVRVKKNKNKHESQLLTMTSLNKMLQVKLSKDQKIEAVRLEKEIEDNKFKIKLLLTERDRKVIARRPLQQRHNNLCDINEERTSKLMESYRQLSKDAGKCKHQKNIMTQQNQLLSQSSSKLHHRRRQLMYELLLIYPIDKHGEKLYINGVYLPSSDVLSECPDGTLSIALGYVAHILSMTACFLQVPLRFPIRHLGSRSIIEDHVSSNLPEKSRQFPLYTRGKDRIHFNYAVYLLNRNIAQYLYMLGSKMPDLKATLQNVRLLLQMKEPRKAITVSTIHSLSTWSNFSEQIEKLQSTESAPRRRKKTNEAPGPGLNDLLLIPEAYMSQEISEISFKNYSVAPKCTGFGASNCDRTPPADIPIETQSNNKQSKRLSRSLGSYTDEELSERNFEIGSEPLLTEANHTF